MQIVCIIAKQKRAQVQAKKVNFKQIKYSAQLEIRQKKNNNNNKI